MIKLKTEFLMFNSNNLSSNSISFIENNFKSIVDLPEDKKYQLLN
jgi:hypothetical protein